jgi:mRNA interferase MazF
VKKNYQRWTLVKSDINNNPSRPKGFKKREIWLCSVGENIGYENDGKGERFVRPILILKTHSNLSCHIVPLSTTEKRGYFYHPFDGHTGKTSVALLSQSRVIDSARLKRKIGKADRVDFEIIRGKIREVLGV